VGGCDFPLIAEFDTDDNGQEIGWAIYPIGSSTAVCSGQGLPSNAQGVQQLCCLPAGCYRLEVTDAGNDGIVDGGYLLRTALGQRIIDSRNNGDFGDFAAIANGEGFCLPLGTDELIYASCDKFWWKAGEFVVANENTAVSAQWLAGQPNAAQDPTSGYEFWIFNPNGGYSFRRFRSHTQSDGFGNVGATRACHMKLNNWAVANHVPQNVLMNVRVRGRVSGVNFEWGPTCRLVRDEALAACPPTKLMDIPTSPFLSCNQFRQFVSTQRVHARPVSGANRYEWRFRLPAEGVEIIRSSTTYFLNLGWSAAVAAPLQNGKTYEVDVRASRDGGLTWCGLAGDPWGDVCLLTIGTAPGMQAGGTNLLADMEADGMLLWPNPTNGSELWISVKGIAEGVETITVDVHDMFGKRIDARTLPAQGAELRAEWPMRGDYAAGMYVMTVTAGERQFVQRLVVQP
jgi:hypothetical protein